MSLFGNLFELFFQCLGSLCTFYFIYKIVSVQNIVQMYAFTFTFNVRVVGTARGVGFFFARLIVHLYYRCCARSK